MNDACIIRGPLLNPLADGTVAFVRDAVIEWDERGIITFVGPHDQWHGFATRAARLEKPCYDGTRLIVPPFADCHIHIPQHPIRGRFLEGIEADPPEGRLIAGLNRNVFPAEARCADDEIVEQVVHDFLADTRRNGVLGGAAYMTVHPSAARIALRMLPEAWSVGLVLMNMNCPAYLRTEMDSIERDIRALAAEFGPRLIVTDRFAVTGSSALRQLGARLAGELGLRMQTHLNEQIAEKNLVERQLYPGAASYTDVYRRDGLLDREPILAHCIHNRPDELAMLREHNVAIAHCPVSNTLLGSGVMPLDEIAHYDLDYALCTDVGASPTTSLLVEMSHFLAIHRGRSPRATPSDGLQRITRAPARILRLPWTGTLEPGQPATFLWIRCAAPTLTSNSADEIILTAVLEDLTTDPSPAAIARAREKLEGKITAVTIDGRTIGWSSSPPPHEMRRE